MEQFEVEIKNKFSIVVLNEPKTAQDTFLISFKNWPKLELGKSFSAVSKRLFWKANFRVRLRNVAFLSDKIPLFE